MQIFGIFDSAGREDMVEINGVGFASGETVHVSRIYIEDYKEPSML